MPTSTIDQKLALVRQAVSRRDWRSATSLCIEILQRDRQQPDAHLVLGLAAAEGGKIDMALRAFDTVLKIDPQRFDARIQKARCLVQAGRHADAEREAAQCIGPSQDNAKLLDLLATIYSHIGRQEQAARLIDRAATLAPNDIAILSNAAAIQLFVGQPDDAAHNLERALQLNPAHARSHWQLAKARRVEDDGHCRAMEQLLAQTEGEPESSTYLHYALGKEYEDLRDWQSAWKHYREGAEQQRRRIHYDADDDRALFQALSESFDRRWFDTTASARATESGPEPLFIVGLPRSGSTLVERILASHSGVQSLGELAQWPLAVKRLSRVSEPGLFRVDVAERAAAMDPQQLADRYRQDTAHLQDGSPHFTDKLPSNFLYLPLLTKAFPRGRFVHVYRNPMDSCFAIYKQLFADAYPFSYSLEELADYYIGYHRLLDHWRDLLGDRLIEINYDELVQNQEQQTRALLTQLGLPFEPACLEFHRTAGAAATASASQVRQPMHSKSIGRWREFAEHLRPLRQRLEAAGVPLD
ncbi:tetratricopeptide repeat-containing sulfotransferase family protein [Microbulbifer marinus]|uniref:Tfp pilus assembly protein PilF n=1 Tax=Microbulbifer marinus TaxID=658218 RepID=A0A1H3ZE81_9GAMM|nr:sulfotransferase [Microbulbifer marinus]SEA21967.1 Tfp pilus assembly protein PilF [Microbulbifer marinus]